MRVAFLLLLNLRLKKKDKLKRLSFLIFYMLCYYYNSFEDESSKISYSTCITPELV